MKWDRLSILRIIKSERFSLNQDHDYTFSIIEILLKNEKLQVLDISALRVYDDQFEQFREALRERNNKLAYINKLHQITLKQYIELE